jgi:uncharacterized protein (DUF433 family)
VRQCNDRREEHDLVIAEGHPVRRIVANAEILGGKPIVEGTRLSVDHILGLLAHGMTHVEIVAAYPELTIDDVKASIQYAAEALHNDVFIEVQTTGEAP